MPQYYHNSYYNQKPGLLGDKKMVLAIGIGIVVIIISMTLLAVSSGGGVTSDLARLTARYQGTTKFLADYKEKINSGDLRKISSDANLLLTSDTTTFSGLLTDFGGQLTEEIIVEELDTTSKDALKTAEQAGNFDTAYKKILLEKFDSCAVQLNAVAGQSSNEALLTALKQAQLNLSSLVDQIKKLE